MASAALVNYVEFIHAHRQYRNLQIKRPVFHDVRRPDADAETWTLTIVQYFEVVERIMPLVALENKMRN